MPKFRHLSSYNMVLKIIIMNYEQKFKEFQTAKERAEQHSFPFIAMFDDIVEKQYNDLKSNYTKEHEELFVRT